MDISTQFHATPGELLPLMAEATRQYQLHVTAMGFSPFEAFAINGNSTDELQSLVLRYRRFAFTLSKPVLDVKNELQFDDANPDHLRIDVGCLSSVGLEQSWLTARTDNSETLATWKKVAKLIKDLTYSGVTAVNRDNGASAVINSFRYSRGAKELESKGVPMIPPQGPNGPIIHLGIASGSSKLGSM